MKIGLYVEGIIEMYAEIPPACVANLILDKRL
jgi:hypothetical protein